MLFTQEGKKRAYSSWHNMRYQCREKWRYSGKGISYPQRWESFGQFFSDMGERPKGTVLTRIDPTLGYGPDNCTYGERKTAHKDRYWNNTIKYEGLDANLFSWARLLDMNVWTLKSRLSRGYTIEKALFTPVKKREKYEIRLRKL